MRNLQLIFVTTAFIVSVITACQNPSDRIVKGNSKKDYGDTIKNQDSIQPPKRLNPGDTARKY